MWFRVGLSVMPCGSLSGCWLFPSRGASKPPRDELEAQAWWEVTIESTAMTDIELLRCWYQASEFHRKHGSSATYVNNQYLGQTMAGPYYCDFYYPAPIPVQLLPKVEARLAREKAPESRTQAHFVTVKEHKNCTAEEAWDAWKLGEHGRDVLEVKNDWRCYERP
jgi:hypothetical protein